jgi:hypothetical protein
LAGPNGNAPEPGMPMKAYCTAPTTWSCSSAAWDGNCSIDARCDSDYTPGVCSGGATTYGVSGTSSLSIYLDGTISPNWISRVSVDPNGSYCSGSVCVDRTCVRPTIGPLFNFFSSISAGSHTFTIDTSTTSDYVPVSMTLNGITPVTCDGSSTCSITATLNKGDNQNLAIVIRKRPVPPPPVYMGCAYGPELVRDPLLTNIPTGNWGFWNGGNASYSFASGGMAKLTSTGNGSGGLQQQILGLAGKNIFIRPVFGSIITLPVLCIILLLQTPGK